MYKLEIKNGTEIENFEFQSIHHAKNYLKDYIFDILRKDYPDVPNIARTVLYINLFDEIHRFGTADYNNIKAFITPNK